MPLASHIEAHLRTIITALSGLSTSGPAGKRLYAELFLDLPSREAYPDYYVYILDPRSLNGVLASMDRGAYSSPQAVAYDLFLIWANARQYNQQGSLVYADADKLETCMQDLWNGRVPPLPSWRSLARPGSLPKPADGHREHRKHKKAKHSSSHRHEARHDPLEPVVQAATPLPKISIKPREPTTIAAAPSTPSANPFKVRLLSTKTAAPIVQALVPPSLPTYQEPVASSSTLAYPFAAAPVVQAPPPVPIAPYVPPPYDPNKKELRKDMRIRQKAEKAAALLRREQGGGMGEDGLESNPLVGPVEYKGIPDAQDGWYGGDLGEDYIKGLLEIVYALKSKTDEATGRLLATPLLSTPDRTQRPDYYNTVKEPISLEIIEGRASSRYYTSPRAFDQDLLHLFAVAKIFIRPDNPGNAWRDLLLLQHFYQELTKRVYTVPPPPTPAAVPAPPPVFDLNGQLVPAVRSDLSDRTFLDGINFKGEILRVGDWVHILNPENPARPSIAQIFKVWKRTDTPQRCITACAYFRSEETVHPASRLFYESEVFKTSNFVDHPVEAVLERCFVMPYARYIRGRPLPPLWSPKMPLYVCEHRYKPSLKSFKRIKTWISCLPEEVRKKDYAIKENGGGAVESLSKIASPFVRGIKGSGGIGEAMEKEEDEQTKYHLAQTGSATTAAVGGGPMEGVLATSMGDEGMGYTTPNGLNGYSLVGGEIGEEGGENLTPAETAALTEAFEPLPEGIASSFRTNEAGDLLWFTAPSQPAPPRRRAIHHSLSYLYWKAQQSIASKRNTIGTSNGTLSAS